MSYPHVAQIYRCATTFSGGAETISNPTVVYSTFRCLIEPLPGWRQQSILGDFGGKKFKLSWAGTEELIEGDELRWNGRRFVVSPETDDRYRPSDSTTIEGFQTAILTEEVVLRG